MRTRLFELVAATETSPAVVVEVSVDEEKDVRVRFRDTGRFLMHEKETDQPYIKALFPDESEVVEKAREIIQGPAI